jgi:hypothetical protein
MNTHINNQWQFHLYHVRIRKITQYYVLGALGFLNFGYNFKIFLTNFQCRNPSLGFATKARGVARLWAKRKPRSHITCSRECKKVRGSEPSHSQDNSHFGRWSPNGLPKLQRNISGVKTQWLITSFISLKSF